jgi:hypothetical protein
MYKIMQFDGLRPSLLYAALAGLYVMMQMHYLKSFVFMALSK